MTERSPTKIESSLNPITDNQAAIRTFQTPTGRSGAYIVAEAIPLIDKLQRVRGIPVEIRWVPAHTGIWGNEAADKAAKTAARQHPRANPRIPNFTHPKTYYFEVFTNNPEDLDGSGPGPFVAAALAPCWKWCDSGIASWSSVRSSSLSPTSLQLLLRNPPSQPTSNSVTTERHREKRVIGTSRNRYRKAWRYERAPAAGDTFFLKANRANNLSPSLANSTITVPCDFAEKQRQAIRIAGIIGGLEAIRMHNKPTSIGTAHHLDIKNYIGHQENHRGTYIVYDTGDKEPELSLVSNDHGVFEVLDCPEVARDALICQSPTK
ncbi:hypothetical protein BKA61DRAFT_673910 [Leptodontidium sp. MPI-SDFR-AT-0119]|nr:hypothetical protein BKA61DRAFT_673910 [Leptodontidium sp. MPI-SDFR-AT-0119]